MLDTYCIGEYNHHKNKFVSLLAMVLIITLIVASECLAMYVDCLAIAKATYGTYTG